MIDLKTGVAVPLSALRTEQTPVVGDFTSLIEFSDFAKKAGLSVIQLLPVLDTGTQSSPYSSLSAFALHPMYIHIEKIDQFSYCYDKDSSFKKAYDEFLSHKKDERFDYKYVSEAKDFFLRKIFACITNVPGRRSEEDMKKNLSGFVEKHSAWLPFYCVYKYLKHKYMQASWKEWPKQHQKMSKEQILEFWNDTSLEKDMAFYAWEQFTAFGQFKLVSDYVRKLGITLKGDLPILLNEDSCDVWAFSEVFNTKMRAGSPPDGDNPYGQNWGFPCYDFAAQEKDGFSWWRLRIKLASEFFGAYRLDHIPGFFRLWSVPDGELTAEMGHSVPYSAITESDLLKSGFSKERIRWLSQPHVPTEYFIRLIGNPATTNEILSQLCEKIGREELWLFKSSIKSESDLRKINLDKYGIDQSIQVEIFNRLGVWWKNRTLIEVAKNKFLPLWKYHDTRAWNSLSDSEKGTLELLITEASKKQEKVWQKQAEKIFSALIEESDMVPCGEDLGVFIPCMEAVLDKFNILGLKVIRWCREWNRPNQPFIPFSDYRKLSIVTTSVHDSSTLRQWYDEGIKKLALPPEKLTVGYFFGRSENEPVTNGQHEISFTNTLEPKTVQELFEIFATTSGAWFINPLQDWLYLDSKYYAEDSTTERINIPGSVSPFNWTWRMGTTAEKLIQNEKLIEKIQRIAKIHDSQ